MNARIQAMVDERLILSTKQELTATDRLNLRRLNDRIDSELAGRRLSDVNPILSHGELAKLPRSEAIALVQAQAAELNPGTVTANELLRTAAWLNAQ